MYQQLFAYNIEGVDLDLWILQKHLYNFNVTQCSRYHEGRVFSLLMNNMFKISRKNSTDGPDHEKEEIPYIICPVDIDG